MAKVHIDPGSLTNGSGAISDPKNTWVGISWVAGNEYLQKCGTTFVTAVGSGGRIAPGVSGTVGARILISSYGTGPKPKIYNRADTGFNLDRRSYVTLENFQIDNTEATAAAIGGGGDTATEAVDNIVRNCEIYGGTVEAMSFVTNASRQTLRGLRVYDNYIHDVGGHGIICAGLHIDTRIYGNRVVRAGLSSGKHGISAHPHRTTSTPSWTLVSGTIYKTAIGAQTNITTVLDIYGVRYVNSNITLARAGTNNAPASGQYGFTGGELYINIGGAPSGQVVFSYSDLTVDFSGNLVEDIVDFDGNEGHGIQLDDLVRDSVIRRNRISGCDGRGIQVNMGRGNTVSDNLVYNCKKDGIRVDVNGAVTNNVYGNTVASGPITGSGLAGIVLGIGNTAKNNVVVGYATGVTGTSTSVEQYNCLNTAIARSGGIASGTGTVTIDPQLPSDMGAIEFSSPLIEAGTYLGSAQYDINGTLRPNPPSIGAADLDAIYRFIDPTVAGPGNGKFTNPFLAIPGTLVGGTKYLYKRGTTFTPGAGLSAIQVGQGGSSDALRVVVGAYGDGPEPIINCVNTTRGVNIGSTDIGFITIQDLHITNVASSTGRRGVVNNVTAPKTVNTSIILQRLRITNVLTDGSSDCNGISLRGANNVIRDCVIEDIADDGIWYHGDNITIERNQIVRVATSGRVAGDNIQCGGASDNGVVRGNYLDHSNIGPKQCYIHNTASAGLLFEKNVCIGFPDASFTTVYIQGITGAIVRYNTILGGSNAHIFMGSSAGKVYSNFVQNDFGIAISTNIDSVEISGNTCIGAGLASVYGIRHTAGAGVTLHNNLLLGWARGVSAVAGCTHSHNAYHQCSENSSGGTNSGNAVTADPKLSASYRMKIGSPLMRTGLHLGNRRDIEGKQRPNPPGIGAFDTSKLRLV